VAELPANAPREFVIPFGIIAVLIKAARPVLDAGDLYLDGKIRTATEEAGDFLFKLAVPQNDPVLAGDRDTLAPAQQLGGGRSKLPAGMDGKIRAAAGH